MEAAPSPAPSGPSAGSEGRRRLSVLLAFRGWMNEPVSCPGCDFTTDIERRWDADAIVFHIPTTPTRIPLRKMPGQTWVAWSMESDVNYPRLADARFMSQFDLTMTYRRDADVVTRYCDATYWLPFQPAPLTPHHRREAAPAVYMVSSRIDRSGRTDYVRELMRHLPVDSYGRSLHNRSLPTDEGPKTKLETIARYRFTSPSRTPSRSIT